MATDVKPRSNRLLMVAGLVVAALAFLLVVVFGGSRGSTTNTADRTVDVAVALVDVPAGQQISDQIVHVVKFAPEQVPAGAFTAIKCDPKLTTCTTPVGQFAAIALPKNTALTSSNVVASVSSIPPAKRPYLDIPAGQVAIAIPAGGELQAVGGFIQPDDRVDVMASGLPDMKPGLWKIVLTNMRINRIGGVTGANAQGIASIYILYVTPDVSEMLQYLFTNGTYKFVLKSQADAKPDDAIGPGTTPGANKDSFNAKFSIPK